MKKKIIKFLIDNGWKRESKDSEHISFNKENSCGIDVGNDEIVFVDDSGDFAHIPLDYYALVGYIFVHRIITPIIK